MNTAQLNGSTCNAWMRKLLKVRNGSVKNVEKVDSKEGTKKKQEISVDFFLNTKIMKYGKLELFWFFDR